MEITRYDTFENDLEISEIIKKNTAKSAEYMSQPDLWNTVVKTSNSKKDSSH